MYIPGSTKWTHLLPVLRLDGDSAGTHVAANLLLGVNIFDNTSTIYTYEIGDDEPTEYNTDRQVTEVSVNEDGIVSALCSGFPNPGAVGGIIIVDGQMHELDDFSPYGRVGPTGWATGAILESLTIGFYEAETGIIIEEGPSFPGMHIDPENETVDYTVTPNGPFVHATPYGQTIIDLDHLDGLDIYETWVHESEGDYVIMLSGPPVDWFGGESIWTRVNIETQEVDVIERMASPPGLTVVTGGAPYSVDETTSCLAYDEGGSKIHDLEDDEFIPFEFNGTPLWVD